MSPGSLVKPEQADFASSIIDQRRASYPFPLWKRVYCGDDPTAHMKKCQRLGPHNNIILVWTRIIIYKSKYMRGDYTDLVWVVALKEMAA
jgi:hypothetical protein